ncbi:MAG: methyltransferase regulatory domain-containing protein [Planctomycetia bacterium]
MSNGTGYITDVSYIPGFFANLAPAALRYVAALNSVAPPPTAGGFRYLELGCGLGRSLTTLAAANPQGEFVGVDINPEHTAFADREIKAGRLTNARMVTSGFDGLPADLGRFDFIGLHGVYSWVSPAVREQILEVMRRHLAPGGLLLVSYNALPGWAHLQPIRGILRQYAALRQGDSLQRIREALAYVVYIRDKHAKYFDDNPKAAAYVDSLLKMDPRYLVHEYLNEHWTSFYFAEVAAAFRTAGLSFTGSLPYHTNFWDLCVRPEFQELFRTTTDRLVTEAHKDFCANTAFRWDIYAREPRPLGSLDERLRIADDLHFFLPAPKPQLPFQANLGVVTTTLHGPVYQGVIDLLAGGSRRLGEILAAPTLAGTPRDELAKVVDVGVSLGLFGLAAGPIGPTPEGVPERLAVPCRFNRALLEACPLAGQTLTLASTRTGNGHSLGDFEAVLLQELLTQGRHGAAERLDGRLLSSGRTVQRDGKPVTDAADRRAIIDERISELQRTLLPQLLRLGIVEPA